MMAICPAGPPNEMNPSFTQKRRASENGTVRRFPAVSLRSSLAGGPGSTASCSVAMQSASLRGGSPPEERVYALEDRAAVLESLLIVRVCLDEPVDDRREPCRLEP